MTRTRLAVYAQRYAKQLAYNDMECMQRPASAQATEYSIGGNGGGGGGESVGWLTQVEPSAARGGGADALLS